ncbi:MAG: lysophospholipid acyltransferase family protein [Oligoflexales bacterium]
MDDVKQTSHLPFSKRLLLAVIPRLVVGLQRILLRTMKLKVIGYEHIETLRSRNLLWVLSVWHQNVLYTPILNRNIGHGVMVSKSFDGDLISGVVELLGHKGIRGSSSRGGREALKNIIRHFRSGFPVAITPDGPKGPPEKVKSGIIIAAQTTGAPIVPFYYSCDKNWISEKSWDKHMIPKPFCTMVVAYGKPIVVPPGMPPEDLPKWQKAIEDAMRDTKTMCESFLKSIS